MEREISNIHRFSSRGAGEPSSSSDASSSVAVAGEEANAHVHVRESAAAPEQSGPVRESVPTEQSAEDDEDVKRWNMESVVDQLLFLIKNSTHRPQRNNGGNSHKNFASNNNSTVVGVGGGGGVVVAAGVVAVDAIIPACNEETVSDEKKEEKGSKKKSSRGSSRSAHTCEVCGKAFAKGQSLGGHKRKHYDIQKLTDKRRSAREKEKAAVERRGGHTVAALVKIEEERTASSCSAPPLQSEGPSAANGARRPHDFDLNEPAAPQEETERKDNDADDLLSFRLWPKFDSHKSN